MELASIAMISSSIWNTILWVMGGVTLLAALWVLINILQFKHKFIVNKVTSGADIVIIDNFRILKRKGESPKLQLLKLRRKAPIPPKEAIKVGKRGRYVVEAWYNENNEFTYAKNDASRHLKTFIDTDDKDFYAQEVIDAKKYDKRGLMEMLPQIAAIGGIMLMLVLLFAFWENITAPSLQAQQNYQGMISQQEKITEAQKNIMENLNEIIRKEQLIRDEQEKSIPK